MKFFTYLFTAFVMFLGTGFAMGATVPNERRDVSTVVQDVLALVQDILKVVQDSIKLATDIGSIGKPSSRAIEARAGADPLADLTAYLADIGTTVTTIVGTTSNLNTLEPGSVNGTAIAQLMSTIEGELGPFASMIAGMLPLDQDKTGPLFSKLDNTMASAISGYTSASADTTLYYSAA